MQKKDNIERLAKKFREYEFYKKKCTVPVENNITREECIDIINKL